MVVWYDYLTDSKSQDGATMMERNAIRSVITAALREAQESSGKAYADLTDDDAPIGGLDGFDSLLGIEVTVMIEERLGCTTGRDSLFVTEDQSSAATLGEICGFLAGLLGSTKQVAA